MSPLPRCSKMPVFLMVVENIYHDHRETNWLLIILKKYIYLFTKIFFTENQSKMVMVTCNRVNIRGKQKQSFFNCLLDMAALEKTGGSRTNSLSIEGHEATNSQTHLLNGHHNGATDSGEHLNGSLAVLARRTTMRKRSVKWVCFGVLTCRVF